MKIITVFKRKGPWGGGSVYTKILVEGLEKKGYRVVFVTDSSPYLDRISADKSIYIKHLLDVPDKRKQIIAFFFGWPIDLLKYLSVLSKLKKLGSDILILQDLNEKILVTPWARLFLIKVYWVEHTSWEPHLVKHPFFPFLKFSAKFAQKIITPSKFVYDQICKIDRLSKKAIIINHGVLPQCLGLEYMKPRIVLAARLSYEKGADVLINALKFTNPDVSVLIIGSGPEENEIRQMIKKLNLAQKIDFIGEQTDPFKYLSPNDILIVPSRAENFPLILLEALSCGLPVIASNVGGVCEIIIDGENGYLFKSGDFRQLADKINYLLINPQIITKIKQKNLGKYQTRFTQAKMIERTSQLIGK